MPGEVYEVTGPRLLSFADVAATLSASLGKHVGYQPVTLDQFHCALSGIGGEMVADVFTEIVRETLDGRNEWLGDGIQRALGREPRSFETFCRAAATTGAWREAA